MLIDKDSPAVAEDSETTWRDALANAKTLLAAIDKAIYALTNTGITEYRLETGQNTQSVKRADIGTLYARRAALLQQIAVLEARLGIGTFKKIRQIVPGF